MINLNDDKFNGKENAVKVFNNGAAGEVIVTVRTERKLPTDNPNAPDWKVYWKEEDGTEINSGFYYLDSKRDNYETVLSINGRILKDILKALYGDSASLPAAPTYKELLDLAMAQIGARPTTPVKIGVTYGTIKYPSKKGYLQLKNSFPFITGNLEEEIAFNWDYDLKHRPKSDSETATESSSAQEASSEKAPW